MANQNTPITIITRQMVAAINNFVVCFIVLKAYINPAMAIMNIRVGRI